MFSFDQISIFLALLYVCKVTETSRSFYLGIGAQNLDVLQARFPPKLARYFGSDTWINDIDKTMIAQAENDLHPVAKPDALRRQVRVIQNIVAR